MNIDYEDLDDDTKLGKGEHSISKPESRTVTYDDRVGDALKKYGIKLASSMEDALKARLRGEKSFTKREIDTCLRQGVDFNGELFLQAIRGFEGMVYEGVKMGDSTAYQLRIRYNEGVKIKKTDKYKSATHKGREAFERKMLKISNDLTSCGLPLWESEIERGFPVELTKPEWMTWGQWEKNGKKISFTQMDKSDPKQKSLSSTPP